MKKTAIYWVVCSAFALAGCGGGGDDEGGNNAAPAAGSSGAQKYVGTWVSNCTESLVASADAPTVKLKSKIRLTFSKVSDTKLSFVEVEDIYTKADCTGAPKASQTNDAPGNSLTLNGTGVAKGAAVDQVTLVSDNVGGLQSGSTININGLVYPGNYFTKTSTHKDIVEVKGGNLKFGADGAAADAQGYPTELNAEEVFTKQ